MTFQALKAKEVLSVGGLALQAFADSVALEANAALPPAAPADEVMALSRCAIPRTVFVLAASIARAVDSFGDTDRISDANIATLERLGSEGWAALRQRCRDDLGTT